MDNSLYDKDSILSVDPREFTRMKPNVYCGKTDYTTQLLVEIVSNSIDEVVVGHGNKIEIISKNGKTSCRDYGQGFLINEIRPEDGKTVLEAAFSVLNTSGKYSAEGVYKGVSLGNFGIGSKLQCFLSTKSVVTSYKDGQYEKIEFEDGIFKDREVGKTKEPNGTLVEWYPDKQFFGSIDVEDSVIIPYLKTLTCLIPGLEIDYNDNKYISENGLMDLVDEAVADKELISNRLVIKEENGKNKMNLILTYTTNYSSSIVPYVNTGLTDSGPHITEIKKVLTREFNKLAKEKKWLKANEDNLTGDDVQEGLYMVFNLTAQGVTYDAQVKSRLTAIDMKPFTQILSEALQNWFTLNEKEVKLIIDKALAARKAREAAKKAREAARNVGKKKEKVVKFDSKLADCWSKDREKCEIYICEGDSASGNLKLARDKEFQAVLPIRGKILNVRKATLDKIQKNAEIMTMIEAFGLKVDIKTMKLTFDPKELRYGKIIIESDADVDGSHIKDLFYTFIWTFCPQLIIDGYVYAGVPPLYKITIGKDEILYLKDDAALEEFRAKNKNKKYVVGRMKGLGEMDADETDILVNENERIIKQIYVDDVQAADKLFDDLFGLAVLPRKKYIQEHSAEANCDV